MLWQNFFGQMTGGRPPVTHPTASKHWRMTVLLIGDSMLPSCCHGRWGTLWWLWGLLCPLASREHPSCDVNSVSDMETARCHHAVTVSQEHCCGRTFTGQMPFLSPNEQCQSTEDRYCCNRELLVSTWQLWGNWFINCSWLTRRCVNCFFFFFWYSANSKSMTPVTEDWLVWEPAAEVVTREENLQLHIMSRENSRGGFPLPSSQFLLSSILLLNSRLQFSHKEIHAGLLLLYVTGRVAMVAVRLVVVYYQCKDWVTIDYYYCVLQTVSWW